MSNPPCVALFEADDRQSRVDSRLLTMVTVSPQFGPKPRFATCRVTWVVVLVFAATMASHKRRCMSPTPASADTSEATATPAPSPTSQSGLAVHLLVLILLHVDALAPSAVVSKVSWGCVEKPVDGLVCGLWGPIQRCSCERGAFESGAMIQSVCNAAAREQAATSFTSRPRSSARAMSRPRNAPFVTSATVGALCGVRTAVLCSVALLAVFFLRGPVWAQTGPALHRACG